MRSYLLCFLLFFSIVGISQPTISSFTPTSAGVGTTLTITGTGFDANPSNNIVYFGATKATVNSTSSSSLTVFVPFGATYQPISVTTNNNTAYSGVSFLPTFSGGLTNITADLFQKVIDTVESLSINSLAIADFDGDGKSDIVNCIGIIYQNMSTTGNIAINRRVNLNNSIYGRFVTTGDINGDGKPDIVITNGFDNSISIYKNTSTVGNISFAAKVDINTGTYVSKISISDFDGDGKPDLIALLPNALKISIFLNSGNVGNISFSSSFDIIRNSLGSIRAPVCFGITDLDNDGKSDISVGYSSNDTTLVVYKNTSTSNNLSFSTTAFGSAFGIPQTLAAGDFNNDGKPDIIVLANSGYATLYKNLTYTGNIFLLAVGTINNGIVNNIPGSTNDISVSDLDGDGFPDIAIVTAPSGFSIKTISVFKNAGSDISFSSKVLVPTNIDGLAGICTADMDNDGKSDLIIVSHAQKNLAILRNNCAGPIINSFSPIIAGTDTVINIIGKDFKNVVKVSFGGIDASSFLVDSSTAIRAVVSTGTTGKVSVVTLSGTGTLSGFTFVPKPGISSFYPESAGVHTPIVINGTDFTNVNSVSIGGTAAAFFSVLSSTTIVAEAASGVFNDSIKITTIGGMTGISGFTFIPPPTISSFGPISTVAGTAITITGTNLATTWGVNFGGTAALSFNVLSPTTVIATVGYGTSGVLSITTRGGTAGISGFVYIPPPPGITSFTPLSAVSGTPITIIGSNFIDVTSISFGGVAASSFQVLSPTTMIATISSVNSGSISITNTGGVGNISGFTYIPPPSISSINPIQGQVGTIVTINGSGFSSSTSNNIIYFGSTRAEVVSATTSQLVVKVPQGARYGSISVLNNENGLTAYSYTAFVPTFTAVNTITSSDFSISSTLSTLGYYSQLTSADLDGDGKPELIAASIEGFASGYLGLISPTSIVVSIYKNNSDSLHYAASSFSKIVLNADGFSDLKIFDIDGDGKLDIAAINYNVNAIYLYRNTSTVGNISFLLTKTVTLPGVGIMGGPRRVWFNDLNNDGKPDLITSPVGDSLRIFPNISAANNFNFGPSFSLPAMGILEFAVDDLDGDGKNDIIIGNNNVPLLSIFHNNVNAGLLSKEAFGSRIDYSFGHQGLYNLSLIDIDGDQKKEIVYGAGNSLYVIHNISTVGTIDQNSLGPITTFAVNGGTGNIQFSDMNGDGKVDLVISGNSSQIITILKNTSTIGSIDNNSLEAINLSAIQNSSITSNSKITTGDFNGDGRPDIAMVTANNYSSIDGHLIVLWNKPNSSISSNIPTITSFTPTSAVTGSIITITGTNFTGATSVMLGVTALDSVEIASPTFIRGRVGAGSSGSVSVTTPNGTASLAGFTYLNTSSAPTITSFEPLSAAIGATLTVTGTNLAGVSSVSLGGTAVASFRSLSSTALTLVVGSGSSGSLSVTTSTGTASLAGFTYLNNSSSPTITSFTPLSAVKGSLITINGTNFTGATFVTLGTTALDSVEIASPTTIRGRVGAGSSGSVSVTTPNGTASLAGFTYLNNSSTPTITSFEPLSAAKGATITITGTNLNGVSSVSLGGAAVGSFRSLSSTTLTAIVGSGSSGSLSVTTSAGSASLAGFTFLNNSSSPTITSFTPLSAVKGSIITIIGTNFTGATSVMLGTTALDSVEIASPTTIRGRVGSGSSGSVSVTTPNGTASLAGFSFIPYAPTITASGPTSFCQGENFVLTSSDSMQSIQWFKDGTLIQGTQGKTYTVSASGIYTLKVGANGLYSALSEPITVTVNPLPITGKPLLTGYNSDTLVCYFTALTLSSKDSYDKYLWSNGETTASTSISVDASTWLKVGNSLTPCYSEKSITVLSKKNLTPQPVITRSGDNLISSSSIAYKWLFNNKLTGDTLDNIKATAKGVYNISTTIDKSCWNTSQDYLILFDPVTVKKVFDLTAYPNPTNGVFNLQLKFEKNITAVIKITIADAGGITKLNTKKLLFNDKSIRIPVNLSLAKGIYTIKVDVNGEINTQQLIVQ
jgi:hypothetical protein